MEPTKHFEELHTATLQKLDDYMKSNAAKDPDHHAKITVAKDKWQTSWNEFLETLVVLEKLEI